MGGTFQIGTRSIGPGQPIYIIAEMSANHNQDFEIAKQIIHAAKEAGADAIKLQTYTPDTLTISSNSEYFHINEGSLWDGRSLYDLYNEAHMPWEWQPELIKVARDIEIDLFSTAYDPTAIDFLENLNVPAHKIASFELIDISLIQKMARTGKPLFISTGMGTFSEIREALNTARNAGAKDIALFKCTSAYPAPYKEMNLLTIRDMADKFKVPIGLSDHTLSIAIPVAAVPLGVSIIEKHITLSRDIKGPDSEFSIEPTEFKEMVDAIRASELALGRVHYGANEEESKSLIFRRSLFVVKDVRKGDTLTSENIRSIRPSYGLPPKYVDKILGNKAARNIKKGTPLSWDLIE